MWARIQVVMEFEICVTCPAPPPPLGTGAWCPSMLVWTDAHHSESRVVLGGPTGTRDGDRPFDEGGVSVVLDLHPRTRTIVNKFYKVRTRPAQALVVGFRLGAVPDEKEVQLSGNVIGTFVAHVSDLLESPVNGPIDAPEAREFAGAHVTVKLVSRVAEFGYAIVDHIERALSGLGNKAVSVGADLAFKSCPISSYAGRTAGMASLDTRFLNGARSKGLPAWSIMAYAPERPEHPEFVEYVMKIAGNRRGLSERELMALADSASDDIFRKSKTRAPAPDTVLFATMVGEAVREVAAFYPYVTDMIDANTGTRWSSTRVRPYELFSAALRVAGGGDCEDKAREVCEIFRGIMRMNFGETHRIARGAWAVSRCYIPLMVLGEVESRATSEYDRERTKQYLVAEDPSSTVRHNAHCYAMAVGTAAMSRLSARNAMHADHFVTLDASVVLEPWEISLPPLLLDGTTGWSEVYPRAFGVRGHLDAEVSPFDSLTGARVSGSLDSQYYYTVRNCFVPYGLVNTQGNRAYEIYMYSEVPGQGTRHAAFIECFYREPHAPHPDNTKGLVFDKADERVWFGATVVPTEQQMRDILPLMMRLQPIPSYPKPASGIHRSASEAISRLRLTSQQHVRHAPRGKRCVAAVQAENVRFVSGRSAVYFDVFEFVQNKPYVHLYVTRS